MKCPRCKSVEVFQSRTGNSSLSPLKRTFFVVLRCHRCCEQFRKLRLFASAASNAQRHRHA